jgi:hypothetical protein
MRMLAAPGWSGGHGRLVASWIPRSRAARTRGPAWLAGILALAAACTHADAKAKADQPPAELLVSVAIGPATTLRNLQAYVDAIKPGAGAALTDQVVRRGLAEMVGASSLDGLDPASWMYVLVASQDGAPAPALLGKIADLKALSSSVDSAHVMIKGSWAVIGGKPLLERVGAYALSAIAAQPTPKAPSATVYLPQVLARYKREIEAARTQVLASLSQASPGVMGKLMTSYVDGLESLIADTERLVVTIEATPELAALDLALTPKAKSRLAAFAALQRPTDYALLERLPVTTPSMLLAGHLVLGPYRDGLLAVMAAMYGPDTSRDMLAAMDLIRQAMTGDVAMAMRFEKGTGMAFTQLYGTADTTAAGKAVASMLDLFKAGRTIDMTNLATTVKANPETTAYDGVTLRSYDTTYDLSKVPAAQRPMMEAMLPTGVHRAEVATFDALTLVVVAPDSLTEARRSIDAARGKAPHFAADKTLSALIAGSRAHKDSVAMVMDLGGILGMVTGAKAAELPMLMSLGFVDHDAHIRLALPAATLRGAVNLGKP